MSFFRRATTRPQAGFNWARSLTTIGISLYPPRSGRLLSLLLPTTTRTCQYSTVTIVLCFCPLVIAPPHHSLLLFVSWNDIPANLAISVTLFEFSCHVFVASAVLSSVALLFILGPPRPGANSLVRVSSRLPCVAAAHHPPLPKTMSNR